MTKTLDEALADLKAAKAAHTVAVAELQQMNDRYAELGRQAQGTGPEVERRALLEQQQAVRNAQTPYAVAVAKCEAAVRIAKRAVGEAAEALIAE